MSFFLRTRKKTRRYSCGNFLGFWTVFHGHFDTHAHPQQRIWNNRWGKKRIEKKVSRVALHTKRNQREILPPEGTDEINIIIGGQQSRFWGWGIFLGSFYCQRQELKANREFNHSLSKPHSIYGRRFIFSYFGFLWKHTISGSFSLPFLSPPPSVVESSFPLLAQFEETMRKEKNMYKVVERLMAVQAQVF